MSYHPGDTVSPVRFRDDVGLELRCTTCPKGMNWWPLTEEFWRFKQSFKRCRACIRIDKNRRQNIKYRTDPTVRKANREYQATYRKEAAQARRLASVDRYWADPEGERQRARERYWADPEKIRAKRRAAHAAKKAA